MKKFLFFVLLALLGLTSFTSAAWDNNSATFRSEYALTEPSSNNATNGVFQLTLTNQSGNYFLDKTRFTGMNDLSWYYVYGNGSAEPLFGSNTACIYTSVRTFGYNASSPITGSTNNGTLYYSIWVKVPNLQGGSGGKLRAYYATNGGYSQYNQSCVFKDFSAAYLNEVDGWNANAYGANASATSMNTINRTQTNRAFWTCSASSACQLNRYQRTNVANNISSSVIISKFTLESTTGFTGTSYIAHDAGSGYTTVLKDGSGVGCVYFDTSIVRAQTSAANFKNQSTYTIACMMNNSLGGSASQNLTLFINGAYNNSANIGNLGGSANLDMGTSSAGLFATEGSTHYWLRINGGEKYQLNESYVRAITDTVSASATFSSNQNLTIIYTPASASTVYNGTTTTVIYALNSTTNASNMTVWASVNGVASTLGYFANGSIQTTKLGALFNGANNNITLTAFDGTSNSSTTTIFTLFNGLNLTAYNASQAITTYLTVGSINVSNSTNSSTNYGSVTPFLFETRLIPNSQANQSVNVTINMSGYATTLYSGNATSGNNSLFSYNIPLWRHQEFKAQSANGTAITSFTFRLYAANGTQTYSTTNGSVYVSLGSVPYPASITGEYTGTGINATNVTFAFNSSSEINYTATGIASAGVIIYAFDEASCSGTCQRIYFSYAATNSTNTTTDYNSLYFVNATYNTFPQGTVTFTFNNTANGTYFPRNYVLSIDSATAQILNVYLLNSSATTIAATYCVQNYAGSAIAGASVTIQRSIAGSYVTVAQGTGAATGCYTFYLDSAVSYQVIGSATGYTTGTFVAAPVSNQIIRLGSSTLVRGFQTAYADSLDLVQTKLQPFGVSLSGQWVLVNFTVYSWNATLTNWGLYCNYNGTTIYNTNITTSPSGGSTTTNVSLLNKTVNPDYFYCYGLFDRTGYNTSYVNQTFFVQNVSQTYVNASLNNIPSKIAGQSWSPQVKAGVAILATLGVVVWAAAGGLGGLAAGVIGVFVLGIFSIALNFIPVNWFIATVLLALAWAWFTSRAY